MSAIAQAAPASNPPVSTTGTLGDRRGDVQAKQERVAALLREAGCDGLLLLGEENFSWFTSGAIARGVLDQAEMPAIYCKEESRWLLCGNVDSQRMFDEELNGLGFQLKEWPWYWGREQLLADLCFNRPFASDRPYGNAKLVPEQLQKLRSVLTPYEQACAKALGGLVSHALEATCRTMAVGETEREIAGQVSHRLLHRGAIPVQIEIAADGRSKQYRRCGASATAIEKYCVLRATARKYGLCLTASRTVCFGDEPAVLKQDHDSACKVSATYVASTWPDGMPGEILNAGKRVYQLVGNEHDWRLCPQGYLSGRLPVEQTIHPQMDLLQAGQIVTWQPSVGVAVSCDSFLVTEQGPMLLTPPELWALKKIRLQGAEFLRPDVLIR